MALSIGWLHNGCEAGVKPPIAQERFLKICMKISEHQIIEAARAPSEEKASAPIAHPSKARHKLVKKVTYYSEESYHVHAFFTCIGA